MAAYDWADWGARVTRNFPWRRWASRGAIDVTEGPAKNGRLGALLYGLAAGVEARPSGFVVAYGNLQYVRGECRFATMTDTVDQAGIDWFAGVVPRLPNESYAAYAQRLVLTFTAGCPSLPGLQKIVQAYLAAFNAPKSLGSLAADTQGGADTVGAADRILPQSSAHVAPLGADTIGAADTSGFADETGPIGGQPTAYVFDHTSDPAASAVVGIADPYFGVAMTYPGIATNLLRVATPISPQLDVLVRAFSAPGTIPVYCTNGPS